MAGVSISADRGSLQRSVMNFSGSGDNTVIAAVASQIIRVYRLLLVITTGTAVSFKDGASSVLAGPMPIGSNGAIVLDFSGDPWFVTTAGNAFIINEGTGSASGGAIWFTQMPF
jgi:hypothetical protein